MHLRGLTCTRAQDIWRILCTNCLHWPRSHVSCMGLRRHRSGPLYINLNWHRLAERVWLHGLYSQSASIDVALLLSTMECQSDEAVGNLHGRSRQVSCFHSQATELQRARAFVAMIESAQAEQEGADNHQRLNLVLLITAQQLARIAPSTERQLQQVELDSAYATLLRLSLKHASVRAPPLHHYTTTTRY
jgi:hypothetical protein